MSYPCKFCAISFTRRDNVQRHQKMFHRNSLKWKSLEDYERYLERQMERFEKVIADLDDDNWGERWKLQRERECREESLIRRKKREVEKKIQQAKIKTEETERGKT